MSFQSYLVFFGDNYYPCGGWSDFKGSFDTIEEAREFLLTKNFDWYQIVDSQRGEIVSSN
jgi:hypothetical protein